MKPAVRVDPPAWYLPAGFAIVFAFAVGVGFVLFGLVPAYFEAAAYERVTGAKVSVWDAVFLDLRVQEEARK